MKPLFTRHVRRRNFAGFPFLVSASHETCETLSTRARDYAASQGFGRIVRLTDRAPSEIALLREQGLLPERPVSFEGKRDFKLLFTPVESPSETPSGSGFAWFGEVEHWTHVRWFPGVAGETGSNAADAATHPFAHSPAFGFLTSNPAHAGCGLQLEAGLHLPALSAERRHDAGIHAVQRALGAMGFALQPLSLRLPGSAEAGYYRLLSHGGMDFPEEVHHKRFETKVRDVLAVEAEAMNRWQNREKYRLEDRVFRALRLLQEARLMEYPELLNLTSFSRIGVYLGLFPDILTDLAETLRIDSQPFHLRQTLPGNADDALVSQARASLARRILTDIQPL